MDIGLKGRRVSAAIKSPLTSPKTDPQISEEAHDVEQGVETRVHGEKQVKKYSFVTYLFQSSLRCQLFYSFLGD